MKMLRSHTIRLNPTDAQTQYFLRAAGIARLTWNWALAEYKALKATGETVDWNALKKRFNRIKFTDYPFVRDVTKCAPEQAFADLRQSILTYYKAKPANPTIRFPGWRKRAKKIGGFGLANDQFSLDGHIAHIPKLGEVNMAEPLRFHGKIMSGRIKEQAGHWYLTVIVELNAPIETDATGHVGLDFGLSHFCTLSTGEVCETQAYFRQSERKLKLLQRGLARKKKGSRNRQKWKARVARLHERIANQRKDFLHKFTSDIAKRFAVVSVETLSLKGLTRTRLAKSFHDAGIGEAIRQLDYKAQLVQKVDRFFPSSKRCQFCHRINDWLTLADRAWDCVCGAHHDRDFNAAVNIDIEGLRLLAGNGYLSVTPVEFATSTAGFDQP
jgi:putative transposase